MSTEAPARPITHRLVVLLSPHADCLTQVDLDTTADIGVVLDLTTAITLTKTMQILTHFRQLITALQREAAPGPRLKWYVRDLRIEAVASEVTP